MSSIDRSLLAALHSLSEPSSDVTKQERYKIMQTQRRHRKLVDINSGHTYTVRKTYKDTTLWRCSHRSKSIYCRATIIQAGKTFKKGRFDHIHQGNLEAAEFVSSSRTSKKRSRNRSNAKQEEMDILFGAEHQLSFTPGDTMMETTLQEAVLDIPVINMNPCHVVSQVTIRTTDSEQIGQSSQQDGEEIQDLEDHKLSEESHSGMGTGSDPLQLSLAAAGIGPTAEHPDDMRDDAHDDVHDDMQVDVHDDMQADVQDDMHDDMHDNMHDDMEPQDEITATAAEQTVYFKEERLENPEYSIVNFSSQRQKDKLIDSAGYTYTLKNSNMYTSYWRCAVRNNSVFCRASVMQNAENFRRGVHDHNHPPKPNGEVAARIVAQIKSKAWQEPDEPVSKIIGEALMENVGCSKPSPGLPKPVNLTRVAVRFRNSMSRRSTKNPKDSPIPPDFLQKIVKRGEKSHIILATQDQLKLLQRATHWYIDINSKVVVEPLKQLLSIHALIEDAKDAKPVPMAYILMSNKKKRDYKAVFSGLKDCLKTDCPVLECTVQYDAPLWRAISEVFDGIQCFGSALHWSQAIWKSIQDFSIPPRYMSENGKTHKFIKKLMALPFLPAELIPKMINKLQQKANTGILYQLLNYIEATWIEGPTCLWSPTVWCIYNQPSRIGNTLQTWQDWLNNKLETGKLPVNTLILHLFSEAKTVTVQAKLASKRNLKRHCTSQGKNHQVIKFWEEYQSGERKLKHLLEACAAIHSPQIGRD